MISLPAQPVLFAPRRRNATPRTQGLPRAIVAFLRTPLVLKLIGANVAIAVITLAAMMSMHTLPDGRIIAVLIGAVIVAQVVNSALVVVALRPIRALEETASRVSFGDMTARVPPSTLADREVTRTSHALNHVLDELMQERNRIRRLAAQVIRVQDDERARIARDLHDTTAQTMAGVVLQLSVAERSCPDEVTATKLEEIRETAAEALSEVRTLSHSVYPRVLQDLGLRAALDWLARRTRETSGLEVDVLSRGSAQVHPTAASALYRVAQEALSNAVRHSSATAVELRLDTDEWNATLEVEDNGLGFIPRDADSQPPGIGIFSMRERIALVDGVFDIDSAPGRGCCVRATVPLDGVRP